MITDNGHDVLTILNRTADWFEANPEGWIKRASALNKFGGLAPPESPDAICFCLIGRLHREAFDLRNPAGKNPPDIRRDVEHRAEDAVRAVVGPRIADFNDHEDITVADVIFAVRKAVSWWEGKP